MAPKEAEAVKVVVRCRPLNSKEKQDGRATIVEMSTKEGSVKIKNPKADSSEPPKMFTFDQVYDWNSNQLEIFDITARPIVDASIEGFNGTVFAYGQTGTGKSHTMEGKEDPPELRGIIPNTFNYIFDEIGKQAGSKEFLVRASYLEIYNEEIRDLLSKNQGARLELKESGDKGVYVKDLMQYVVKNVVEMNNVLLAGRKNRSVGATAMNQDSSRSHSIFTVTIETVEKFSGTTADAAAASGDSHIRVGKLNLVDLAGSERQSKTGATGDRLKEGIKINLSLTALGNVISALVDGKGGHVPYRDSKLTRLLQDSLGGNTKTVMIANVGPADWNYDETMSTLRYANRAKNIQNKPRINEDPKDAMLREFQEEIQRLKALLQQRGGGGGAPGAPGAVGAGRKRVEEKVVEVDSDIEAIKAQIRAEYETKLKQDLGAEAMQKAKEEIETNARKQLEAIAQDASKTEEQRKKARDAAKAQHAEIDQMSKQLDEERKEKESLEAKIQAMESKVLQGGVNLLEKVDELKKKSEDLKRQADIRKRQQEEHERRLQDLEVQQLDFGTKYSSLEEEVQVKSRQLKKLFEKYQAKKAEITDLQEQFQREREGLLEDYRILTQQIKLKNLIIACFIPPDYQDRIMQQCHWQDYENTWNIDAIAYAGNAIRAHQELTAAQDNVNDRAGGGGGAAGGAGGGGTASHGEGGLGNVYFSYQGLEEELGPGAVAVTRPSSAGPKGRPKSSSGRPGSTVLAKGTVKAGRKDPTDIGTLRDGVAWGADEAAKSKQQAAFPKARGLVNESVDLRRGKK